MAGEAKAYFVLLDTLREGIASLEAAVTADVETVVFPAGGGSFDLGLAIPRLPDMDEVLVDTAEITIHAREHPVTLPPPSWPADAITPIDLPAPGRLLALEVTFGGPLNSGGDKPDHLLVSTGEKGASVPTFAWPHVIADATLYPAPLRGMRLTATSGDARATFESPVAGQHWTVTVAHGAKAADLEHVSAPTVAVRGIEVDASPTDLTITIPGAAGRGDAVLFASPGTLLPSAEPHEVSFAPLAQRHLQAALDAQPTGQLLPVPIRLSSTTEGAIGIVSRTLRAHFQVHATGPLDPVDLATGGSWAVLPLALPPRIRPTGGTGSLRGRLAGYELDPAFGPPPFGPPPRGVTVRPRRPVAVAASMQAVAGGSPVLAAARILAGADRPAEVALEVRRDVAGLPGEVLATVVRKLPPGPAWHEFLLPAALALPSTRVWCAVRANDEPVRWFAAGDEPPVVSDDDGASWGAMGSPLEPPATPLVQLFRPLAAGAVPTLDLVLGGTIVGSVPLARTPGDVAGTIELPPAVLDAIGAASEVGPNGRAVTQLRLYSPAVMTLAVADVVCAYDPQGAG